LPGSRCSPDGNVITDFGPIWILECRDLGFLIEMTEVVVVHVVPIDDLDSPDVLRVEDPFEAGNHQPQRKSVLRPHGFAVHAIARMQSSIALAIGMLDAPFTSSAPSATNHFALPSRRIP
jgi:hypothetical protein